MGELRGKQIPAKEIAALCWARGWKDSIDLVTIVAVCLSESQGYQRAYNDNIDKVTGEVKSRDCGIFQINIPASQIGTEEEEQLYADLEYNVDRAYRLFERRGFQPWYAWTLRVYLRDGYIERASRGVGNFLAEMLLMEEPTDTLKKDENGNPVPYVHKYELGKPVLNFQRRVEVLAGTCERAITMAKAIKPIAPPAVDAKIDELVRMITIGRNEAKK